MPASSKQQQKFMGLVHALKKGDIKPSDVSQSVKDAAKSMSKKDAKDFASTSHKGLPRKVKQEIINKLKEYANKMSGNKLGGSGSYGYAPQKGLRDDDGYDNVDYNKDMPRVNENEQYVAYAYKGNKVVKTVRDSKYNDKLFSKFKKDMERKGFKVNIDLLKNRKVVRQVYKTNESINERMDKRQAGELIKQLGGNKFIAMTGAKNFVVGPKGAGFKIGRNSKGINYVRIDLDGRDLYNMEFIQARGGNMKVKSKEKGVYFDQLRKLFTKNTGMYTSLGEGMFSTLDQIRQDSKSVRDFVKNVFSDRDFKDMKNDKDFIKYLKSIYEGVTENSGISNWMQGRTSDYHTQLRGKKRKYDDTNFEKEDSGQHDIEEGFDKVEHLQLLNKALRAMPGSPKQKDIIRKLNKVRKAGGMRPLKERSIVEYGQRLDLSYLADEEAMLKGTPKPKDAIDRDLDEYLGGSYEYTKGDQYGQNSVNEVGVFPIQNYLKGIIPSGRLNITNDREKEKVQALLKDLIGTLNHFWKSNKIPFRVREPRKSDLNKYKQKSKRY